MKYDELIKALRETDFCDGCPCERVELCKDKDCVIVQAADAIEELTMKLHGDEAAIAGMKQQIERMVVNSGNKPKWIPVSERLPELGETVLVCYQWLNPSNKLSVTCDSLHIHSTTMKPVWRKHNHSYRVLYWMQLPTLPEPPKEES